MLNFFVLYMQEIAHIRQKGVVIVIDKSREFQITFDYLDREYDRLIKKEKDLLREIKKLDREAQRRVEQSKNNEISDPKLLRLTIEGQKKKQG